LNIVFYFLLRILIYRISDDSRICFRVSRANVRYIKSKDNGSPISNEIGSETIASLAISFVRNVAFVCYWPL